MQATRATLTLGAATAVVAAIVLAGMTANGAGDEGGGTEPRPPAPTSGVAAPAGELSALQRTSLAAMAEEEKLAHDLYVALAAEQPDRRFDQISQAETRHLEAVRGMLARYEIPDPTDGVAAGQFASAAFQAMYDSLLAQGSASPQAALDAGATVERRDIADLEAALEGLTASDVSTVYANLLRGSQQHLRAFTR